MEWNVGIQTILAYSLSSMLFDFQHPIQAKKKRHQLRHSARFTLLRFLQQQQPLFSATPWGTQ